MVDLWRIELLGNLRVVAGEQTLTRFEYRHIGAMLACIALSSDQRRTRDELANKIWPNAGLRAGRSHLCRALWSLRREFETLDDGRGGPFIVDRHSIQLRSDIIETDVGLFEEALCAATTARNASEKR